jgi:hypothetical protein
MREDEARAGDRDGQVEQLLVVADDDVGVVHQHDQAEFSGGFAQCLYPRIGGIETLGMRVQLDRARAPRDDALEFGQRRLPVIGMDRGNRQQLRIFRRQREKLVILGAGLRQLAAHRHMNAAEARDPLPRGAQLRFIVFDGLLAFPDVNVKVEDLFLGMGRRRERQKCRGNNGGDDPHSGFLASTRSGAMHPATFG